MSAARGERLAGPMSKVEIRQAWKRRSMQYPRRKSKIETWLIAGLAFATAMQSTTATNRLSPTVPD